MLDLDASCEAFSTYCDVELWETARGSIICYCRHVQGKRPEPLYVCEGRNRAPGLVALGDSVPFGARVRDEETYPTITMLACLSQAETWSFMSWLDEISGDFAEDASTCKEITPLARSP